VGNKARLRAHFVETTLLGRKQMKSIIVIGGGPAGMIAAGTAAEHGAHVTLLEKNEKLGKKLYITGKGRCNLTNNADIPGLLSQTISNPRFMQSAFHALDAHALMEFFESLGTPLKTERGGRVFPVSDKADDITKALAGYMRRNGVKVELNCTVEKIEIDDDGHAPFRIISPSRILHADAVIIATGGLSYPSTGSTGDGFTFAQSLGHSVTPTFPSLVPLSVAEPWVSDLTGLSLRNVRCIFSKDKALLYEEMGEMLFTPSGVTGPIILRGSAFLTEKLAAGQPNIRLEIDLKPALTQEQLDIRILRDFDEHKNKSFANALDGLLPKRLIHTIITLSQISPDKKVNTITKKERQSLVQLLKALPLTPTKTTGFREAVITRGGVMVNEINPSTMMSKKHPGLYFAGEVLDVDALTGGYNLQIAFSTGYLAGRSAGGR